MARQAGELGIEKVLVALSGGADSIATAHALKKTGIDTLALHCNFHLRGEESDRDMKFVENFCHNLDIPLISTEFDVEDYRSKNKNVSIEMACRNLRHKWFEQKLSETGFDRLATGHNADDNIETFFLNMLRGAGTRGLRGMQADNGKIWRPLLSFHRSEILEYIFANNLKYVVDSTNLTSDYRRNYLRNEIIPAFRKEWKGFDAAMDKTLLNLAAENKLIESFLKKNLPSEGNALEISRIIDSPAPLLIIKRFIDPLKPFSTTPHEILSAIKANKPHIRKWRLGKGIVYLRNGILFVEMGHGE